MPSAPETKTVVSAAMAFQVKPVSNKERYLKMLIYGDYGVGKTFLAGTSADVGNMQGVFLLNAEAGDLTLDGDEHNFEEIDSANVTTYEQVSKVFNFLKAHCAARDAGDTKRLIELQSKVTGVPVEDIKEPKIYRTVIVDSLTEIEQYCINQLSGVSFDTDLAEETMKTGWDEFRQNNTMMNRAVRNFRNLPMHVIFTSARQYQQDETKTMKFTPAMTGKLVNQVQGFMDLVGYYVVGSVKDDGTIPRRLYVQPSGKFAAKCRFSRFKGASMDNPTMGTIMKEVGLASSK